MTDDLIDEPLEVGDEFEWVGITIKDGIVEILSIYVNEDGITQIHVNDCGDKRTVTAMDVINLINEKKLERVDNE